MVILSTKEFEIYFYKCFDFSQEEFDNEVRDIKEKQPNLLEHILFALRAKDLNTEQRDFMIMFFVSLWKLVKENPAYIDNPIELKHFDDEYKNNQNYFKNIGAINKKKEFDDFVKIAFEGYGQKQFYLLVFKYFFQDDTFKNLEIPNLLNWFCISKSCVDVFDKVLNNKY